MEDNKNALLLSSISSVGLSSSALLKQSNDSSYLSESNMAMHILSSAHTKFGSNFKALSKHIIASSEFPSPI